MQLGNSIAVTDFYLLNDRSPEKAAVYEIVGTGSIDRF
jgi:hypothetical protein